MTFFWVLYNASLVPEMLPGDIRKHHYDLENVLSDKLSSNIFDERNVLGRQWARKDKQSQEQNRNQNEPWDILF